MQSKAQEYPSWNFVGIDIKDTFVDEAHLAAAAATNAGSCNSSPTQPHLSLLCDSDATNKPSSPLASPTSPPSISSPPPNNDTIADDDNIVNTTTADTTTNTTTDGNNLYYEFCNANVHLAGLVANYPGRTYKPLS